MGYYSITRQGVSLGNACLRIKSLTIPITSSLNSIVNFGPIQNLTMKYNDEMLSYYINLFLIQFDLISIKIDLILIKRSKKVN